MEKGGHEQSMLELPEGFVAAPMKEADLATPHAALLKVYDLDTKIILPYCSKVDCDAGMAWTQVVPGGRSTERPGRYVLICRTEEAWRWMKV